MRLTDIPPVLYIMGSLSFMVIYGHRGTVLAGCCFIAGALTSMMVERNK